MNKLGYAGKPGLGWFLRADPPQQADELNGYAHEQEHKQLESLAEYREQAAGEISKPSRRPPAERHPEPKRKTHNE
jgi:ubiquinol-cytochrome c reductase cytochrome b subunit